MSGPILAVNVGSTSVKLAMFAQAGDDDPVWHSQAAIATAGRVDAIAGLIRGCPEDISAVRAVGHRIVHGGVRFDAPVVVDAAVERAIAEAAEFAPLHNQAGLDGIVAARRVAPAPVPHIAVFDTAFHRTIPPAAATFGGPFRWFESGLRRYGFHGISHQHAVHRAAHLLDRPVEELRLVSCHLGGGCSVTAADRGRSVDTTMGLTPLDGLIMATRSGAVDPGLVLHLLRRGDAVDEVEDVLEHRSGLAGLSGVSGDLREVMSARDDGNDRARLAIDAFVHRVASGIGAMLAALGRLDGLVFTGGIGEHSPEIRARVTERFEGLGAILDGGRNVASPGDAIISSQHAAVAVMVVIAREEAAIARAAGAFVAG